MAGGGADGGSGSIGSHSRAKSSSMALWVTFCAPLGVSQPSMPQCPHAPGIRDSVIGSVTATSRVVFCLAATLRTPSVER